MPLPDAFWDTRAGKSLFRFMVWGARKEMRMRWWWLGFRQGYQRKKAELDRPRRVPRVPRYDYSESGAWFVCALVVAVLIVIAWIFCSGWRT